MTAHRVTGPATLVAGRSKAEHPADQGTSFVHRAVERRIVGVQRAALPAIGSDPWGQTGSSKCVSPVTVVAGKPDSNVRGFDRHDIGDKAFTARTARVRTRDARDFSKLRDRAVGPAVQVGERFEPFGKE